MEPVEATSFGSFGFNSILNCVCTMGGTARAGFPVVGDLESVPMAKLRSCAFVF